MAHIHPIIDSEPHFIIDTVTRQIINKEKKKRLIQGDHDSERFTFELPREVEGHLMTEVTSCKVHYINIDKYDKELTSKSFFPVTDLKVEGDTVTFSWLISGVATKYCGTINFIIEFECVLDGEINYVWQTDIYRGFPVQESFSNSEYIFEEYYDVIEQWGKEVFAKVGKVKTVGGIAPDDNGNVPLDFLDAFPRGLSVEGGTDNNARVVLTDVKGDAINSFNISGNENVTVKSDKEGIKLEVADSTEVVQEIGISETAVMSQKAVTESLEAVRSEIPEIPEIPKVTVQSVNGKTGEVQLNAADVGADTSGTAALAVSEHNTNTETHGDIRIKLEDVIQRLNALANSDDTTLDQLSEIVAYIKANRNLIESVTSSKLGVDDIINNLTTNVSNKPLSAAQGVALKALIDKLQSALNNIKIPTKVSELTNDLNFAKKSEVPTKTSDLTNDVGYINQETFNNHKHYWRQIIDRPFGEFPTEKSTDTVVSDDKVYGTLRWVSDAVPKFEDLIIGGSISYYNVSNGVITGELQTITFPQGDYTIASSDNGLIIRSDGIPMIVISFNGNPKFGAVTINDVNETGIFFDQGKYGKCIHSLKLNGYTGFKVFEKRKLGKEWLPEDIGAVKTVNYIKPDPNGNINIEGGSGTESNAFELIKGDTLVWNGNLDGRIVATNVPDPSLSYVCVSNVVPTVEELQKGGTMTSIDVNGSEYTEPFTSSNVSQNGNLINCYDGYILVAKADGVRYTEGSDIDCTLPKAGIYFAYFGADGYVSRLSVTDYTGFTKSILKMESLTLHQHDWYGKAVVGGNTVRGDETLQGKWVKVSDEVPTEAEINNGGVVRYYNVTDDVISDELITGYYPSDDYVVTVKDEGITIRYGLEVLVIISFNGSSSIGGFTFKGIDSPGVYFKQVGQSCVHSFTINGYTKFSYNVEKIPFELIPEGIGGGVKSWNDLPDRPFGETTVMGDTLTWDGNTDGLYNIMDMFFRVSGNIPNLSELQNGGEIVTDRDGLVRVQFTSENVIDGKTAGIGDCIVINIVDSYGNTTFLPIVLQDDVDMNFMGQVAHCEKAGVYFYKNSEGASVSSFTINNYKGFETTTIKTLDMKFLPESHQFGEKIEKLSCGSDCFEYAGFEEDRAILMVTKLVPIVIGNKCTVTINGTPYDCNVMDFGAAMEIPAGMFALVTNAESLEEAESSAIFAMLATTEDAAVMLGGYGQVMLPGEYDESVSVFIEQVATTIKTIDKKYIPNNGAVFSAASDTLTFAGDLSSRVVWSLDNGSIDAAALVKLSNVAPTLEDLQKGGAVLSILDDGTWSETEFDASAVSVEAGGWIKLAVDVGFIIIEKPMMLVLSAEAFIPISEAGIYTLTLGGSSKGLFLSSQGIRLNDYTGFITHEIENSNQRPVLSIDGIKPDRKGNVKIVHPEIPVVKIVEFTTADGVTTTEEDLDDIQGWLAKDNAVVKARRKKPGTAGNFECIFYEVTYYDRKPVSQKIQFERRNGSSTETIIWSNDGVTIG